MRSVVHGVLVTALALIGVPAVRAQAPQGPTPISPFPTGLSGTVAFQSDARTASNPDGRARLYTIDLQSGRVAALPQASDADDEQPRWSPDGRRIAFKSNRFGNFDLFVMNADGTNLRRITDHEAHDHDPAWLPDGEGLVFTSERDSRADLYRVWLSDLRVDRLTDHFVGRAIMPHVSPDGNWVAFSAQTYPFEWGWTYQIHVLEMATLRTWPFDESGPACWPNWSPDGQSIAHVWLGTEPSQIQTLSSFGASPQRIAGDTARWHYYPDWSPDGRLIAASVSPEHHEGEDWDLAIMDPARNLPYQRLTSGAGNDRLPDWKPR